MKLTILKQASFSDEWLHEARRSGLQRSCLWQGLSPWRVFVQIARQRMQFSGCRVKVGLPALQANRTRKKFKQREADPLGDVCRWASCARRAVAMAGATCNWPVKPLVTCKQWPLLRLWHGWGLCYLQLASLQRGWYNQRCAGDTHLRGQKLRH